MHYKISQHVRTELIYCFQSFVLADYTAEELRASDNPFGLALEAARLALDPRLKDDDQLMVSKLNLIRHLLSRGLSKVKIRRLYNFINMYVSFQNSENTLKFEKEVREITKSRKPMGLEEAILKEVREQGIEQGIEKGIEKGIGQEKQLAILRAYENGIATAMIAKIVDLPLVRVESVIAAHEKGDPSNEPE